VEEIVEGTRHEKEKYSLQITKKVVETGRLEHIIADQEKDLAVCLSLSHTHTYCSLFPRCVDAHRVLGMTCCALYTMDAIDASKTAKRFKREFPCSIGVHKNEASTRNVHCSTNVDFSQLIDLAEHFFFVN
jgi:hypothetical protein